MGFGTGDWDTSLWKSNGGSSATSGMAKCCTGLVMPWIHGTRSSLSKLNKCGIGKCCSHPIHTAYIECGEDTPQCDPSLSRLEMDISPCPSYWSILWFPCEQVLVSYWFKSRSSFFCHTEQKSDHPSPFHSPWEYFQSFLRLVHFTSHLHFNLIS